MIQEKKEKAIAVIGNGKGEKGYSFSICTLDLTIEKEHLDKNYTLRNFVDAIAKELEIKNGEVELQTLSFVFRLQERNGKGVMLCL
jgi:hypothetical protein